MSIEVREISKTFGRFRALKGVDLTIPDGQLVALLGPSGSGKTTLLRVIAGLEQPDEGRGAVLFDGRDLTRRSLADRGVGFVFQHYALFRHMTVFENVAFGLRVRPRRLRPPKREIHKRVHDLLDLVQMEGLAQRYPHQLSGGQRQRVALARALAIEPRVLLLDEPFGALDAKVRQDLRGWLRRLHDELHVTSVFVTHDQEEALEVADLIAVMDRGTIEQVGTPEDVFRNPRTELVMSFLGTTNRFHGSVLDGHVSFGTVTLPAPGRPGLADGPAHVFVRPHELDLAREPNGRPGLAARVRRVRSAGAVVRLEVDAPSGETILVEVARERCSSLDLQPGASIFLVPTGVRVFPRTEPN